MGVLTPAFPAPLPSNTKSIRFYRTGAATGDFADNQWAFERVDPANPVVPEQGWSGTIRVRAINGDLEISFDGTNVHGFILSGTVSEFYHRHEGGISVRGGEGATFHIEAW